MGMTITVEIIDTEARKESIEHIFDYLKYIDQTFSTYKSTSEITEINEGKVIPENYSQDMKTVFALAEKAKKETNGYFDIVKPDGKLDPSGLVKGWAIFNSSEILKKEGYKNFYH